MYHVLVVFGLLSILQALYLSALLAGLRFPAAWNYVPSVKGIIVVSTLMITAYAIAASVAI
jgi:hypothetical protein